MADFKVMIDNELKEYRKHQSELTKLGQGRSSILTQLSENELVKDELDLLETDAEIYKLVGPVLVRQEKSEAVSNVTKRIEFIKEENGRLEKTIQSTQTKMLESEKKLRAIQLQAQQAAQQKQ